MFDLSAAKSVSIQDLCNMLINLPIEAMIVDFSGIETKTADRYKIVRAPADSEGIRRKRKLLAQQPGSQTEKGKLGMMCFKEINPDEISLISRSLVAQALDLDFVDTEYRLKKTEFSKFLDANPIIRTIVIRSVNP